MIEAVDKASKVRGRIIVAGRNKRTEIILMLVAKDFVSGKERRNGERYKQEQKQGC